MYRLKKSIIAVILVVCLSLFACSNNEDTIDGDLPQDPPFEQDEEQSIVVLNTNLIDSIDATLSYMSDVSKPFQRRNIRMNDSNRIIESEHTFYEHRVRITSRINPITYIDFSQSPAQSRYLLGGGVYSQPQDFFNSQVSQRETFFFAYARIFKNHQALFTLDGNMYKLSQEHIGGVSAELSGSEDAIKSIEVLINDGRVVSLMIYGEVVTGVEFGYEEVSFLFPWDV